MDDNTRLRDAELELLDSTTRQDGDRVRALLHPEFVEIGRSGRRWNRDEIVEVMAFEPERVTPETGDWEFVALSEDVTLVTYVVHTFEGDSRHSSVWDTSTGEPVLRFHQGTVVPAAVPA